MRWETHEAVTRCALQLLRSEELAVRLPPNFTRTLISENVRLDKSPEYVEEVYVDRRGYVRSVRRRVPHHSSRTGHILSKLDRVRGEVLRRGALSREVGELARALHYVQDRCVPPPSWGRELHDEVEKGAARSKHLCVEMDVPRPLGRGELRRLLEAQPVAREPRDAVACAILYTYAVLYAVLVNPLRAPEHMVERAVRVRGLFAGWRLAAYLALALASIAACALLLLALLRVSVYLLALAVLLMPAVYPALNALGTLSRDLDTFLRSLRAATEHRSLAFLLPAVSLGLAYDSLLLIACTFTLLVAVLVLSPYLLRDFREIRDDITWFLWRS